MNKLSSMQQLNVEHLKPEELESSSQELTGIIQEQSSEEIVNILVHELSQPLTTMSLYIWGCMYRLMKGTQDPEPILHAMHKALQDLEYAQEIVFHMQNFIPTV